MQSGGGRTGAAVEMEVVERDAIESTQAEGAEASPGCT
jgi:hypothetical protein